MGASTLTPDYIIDVATGRSAQLHVYDGGDIATFLRLARSKADENSRISRDARASGQSAEFVHDRLVASFEKADVVVLFYPPDRKDPVGIMLAKGRAMLRRHGVPHIQQGFHVPSRRFAEKLKRAYGDRP